MFKTLEELISVIRQRKRSSTEESYTNKLLNNKKLSVVYYFVPEGIWKSVEKI